MTPHFSVIIPLYNKEKHIESTLKSVINQSLTNIEIIVINDGSKDSSKEIVQRFKDHRIQLFDIENSGVSYARNHGVSKAKSNLIAFLDADDLWTPNHLKELKELYEDFPNCGLYAKAYSIRLENKIIESRYHKITMDKRWRGILDNYFISSLHNNIAHTSAIAIPKQKFIKLNGFNEQYNSFEDIDLWIRIALNYAIAFDNKISVTYVKNDKDSLTNVDLVNQNIMDFTIYKDDENTNIALKKYLDTNRLSLALQHKLNGDTLKANTYISQILPANMTSLQKILFRIPSNILKNILRSRNKLRHFGIDLRLFR